jgi:inner membrane protein
MDPLSQAALGAAWAQPAGRGRRIVAATAAGAIAGMAPDLDVLIRSDGDPLLAIEYHRHFTHSLAFVPAGALICSLLLLPLLRRWLSWRQCYLFSLLGFASHGLLDACTSYGTRLFWPFSDRRVAWDIVSVVDPLVTLPLLGFVIWGAVRRRPGLALAGLAWCVAYLGLGAVQNQRALHAAQQLAIARGHAAERIEIRPSFGNIVLWKSIYEHDGRFFIDAIRVAVEPLVIEGESLRKLEPSRDLPWLAAGTRQAQDLDRFRRFADGYLAQDRQQPLLIVDMRYSLVPNRGDGLWGIRLDPDAPADAHAAYVTMRDRPPAEGVELLNMLFRGNRER